jgi:phospholipase C
MDQLVGYDRREHRTVVGLEAGESRYYRLPPITPGQVTVAAPDQLRTDPRDTPPGDGSGQPPRLSEDLELELTHPGGVLETGSAGVTANSLWSDALWRLRVTNKRAPGSAARDVPLDVTYQSTLPIRERRVPADFYHEGLANNYNKQEYLQVALDGNYLEIGFRDDFRLLYGLETPGDPKHLFKRIFSEYVSFPERTEMAGPVFDIGAGPHPDGSGNAVFFSIRADFPAMRVDVTPPAVSNFSVDLIPFSIRLKLWLTTANGHVHYTPFIESELLDALDRDITYPDPGSGFTATATLNPKTYLRDRIQETLFRAQYPFENARDYPSSFGSLLGRWLAGREAPIRGLGYAPGSRDVLGMDGIVEPASGDILVRYVGPREKPELGDQPQVLGPDGGTSVPIDDGSVPLFDPPFRDEEPEWDPSTTDGLPELGGGFGHSRDLGPLAQIDHIVVLMQENRSFDHLLGYLSKLKIKPEVDGLLPDDHPGAAGQYNHYTDPYGGQANLRPTRAGGTGWDEHIPGPCHEHYCVVAQVSDGMGGFVSDFARRIGKPDDRHSPAAANDARLQLVMEYHVAEQLPMYDLFQQEFVICDSWYKSHPGPTWPNRFILLTGDLNKDATGNVEEESPDPTKMPPIRTKTIFDYLTEWGISWRIFEHGYSFLRLFRNFTYDRTDILPFNDENDGFEATARSGRLPSVTLIEPDYIELPPGNDDHAPADLACGQDLVNRIFQALLASPDWERALFLITYDEHGGFYDHRVPPTYAVPPLANNSDALGPRVPGFVISPLVERGKVAHELFDHTSIGATIVRRFAPIRARVPTVTPRMDAARDFGLLLTQPPRPRTDYTSLDLPPLLDVRYKDDPEHNPCRRLSASASLMTDSPKEDFHWLLAAVRLATGEPPRPVRRRHPVVSEPGRDGLPIRDVHPSRPG